MIFGIIFICSITLGLVPTGNQSPIDTVRRPEKGNEEAENKTNGPSWPSTEFF